MNVARFISKWRGVQLTERSAAQQHFLDLCDLLNHPRPADADPTGESFTFERGAHIHGGGDGWADVWKRGFFGWEYKGRHRDLGKAYDQLLRYREDLENPPLLTVCDMDRIVIHTNFTATPTVVHEITLDNLAEAASLQKLQHLFFEPNKLRPGVTSERITAEAASHVAEIAQSLRERGFEPEAVARFLDRIVFCLFAEDIGLLRQGLFSELVEHTRQEPERFKQLCGQLFEAMSTGGFFVYDQIRHFNGNLFTDSAVLALTADELAAIHAAAKLDWGAVDPSIFGTLFERGMDPAKRSQLGAHYTSREDIETLVDPVVMQPLRREWDEVRTTVENLLTTGKKHEKAKGRKASPKKAHGEAGIMVRRFLERLAHVKVLDPACGSGNFLYITLQKLKDLEKEAIVYAMDRLHESFLPMVGPWQLYGIEISPYAHDLAQMTVWIGYLQWTKANGFGVPQDPILRRMDRNFQCKDAILDLSDPSNPKEPEWPKVDCIVGNPPFLGNKRMRSELGTDYIEALWSLYADRIPAMSDLCCYWFEKARAAIEEGRCQRAGLLATTAIRQAGARRVLERICATGGILFAVSDRDWILDGASVRISMIGFGGEGATGPAWLDGRPVQMINADLTSGTDLTKKARLAENAHLCFMGTTKVGTFDVATGLGERFLDDQNPHCLPNSDVVRPFRNGSDLVRRNSRRWIVDFGVDRSDQDAALYQAPFEYVLTVVKPMRITNSRSSRARCWWRLGETIPAFRMAASGLSRYIATARVAKHRVFVWLDAAVLPDSKVIAVTLEGDYALGILHSRLHEIWTRAMCGWHGGERPTYNPTSCFETFTFPWSPGTESVESPLVQAIADAARKLNALRENWLNPPEWTMTETLEFPGTVGGPWDRYVDRDTVRDVTTPDAKCIQIGTVRYPRIVPRDEQCAKRLKQRTLTNLYNARPAWLDHAHGELDEAVFAAYASTTDEDWPSDMDEEEVLSRLLALNLARARAED